LRKIRNRAAAERSRIKKEAYAEILRENNTSGNHAKGLVSYVLSKIRAENDALRIKIVAKEKYREVLRNRIASQIQEK
jgi:hypothetical protein